MKIKIIALLLYSYAIFASDQNQNSGQDVYPRLAGGSRQVAEALSHREDTSASSAVAVSTELPDTDRSFFAQHQKNADLFTDEPMSRDQYLFRELAMNQALYNKGFVDAQNEAKRVINLMTNHARSLNERIAQLEQEQEQHTQEMEQKQERYKQDIATAEHEYAVERNRLQCEYAALQNELKAQIDLKLQFEQESDRLKERSNRLLKTVMRSAVGIAINQVVDVFERKYYIESGMTRKQANMRMLMEQLLFTAGFGLTCAVPDQDLSDIQIPVLTSLSTSMFTILADYFMQPDYEIEFANNAALAKKIDEGGATALMQDDYELAKIAFAHGVDVHARDNDGKTALAHATSTSLIQLLIEKGARLEDKDAQGRTALTYAVQEQDNKQIQRLVDVGADLAVQDKQGKTLLDYAQSKQTIRWLLDHGLQPTKCLSQVTLLKNALLTKDRALIKLLLSLGLSIDVQDEDGRTALMYLVEDSQDCRFIEWLIDQGFDVHIKDKFGKTAWDFARSKNRWFTGRGETSFDAERDAQRQIDRYQQVVELLQTGKKKSE